jgi:hypothetical protein
LASRRTQLKVIRGSAFFLQLLRFLIGTRMISHAGFASWTGVYDSEAAAVNSFQGLLAASN